jgi:hypothetical protein
MRDRRIESVEDRQKKHCDLPEGPQGTSSIDATAYFSTSLPVDAVVGSGESPLNSAMEEGSGKRCAARSFDIYSSRRIGTFRDAMLLSIFRQNKLAPKPFYFDVKISKFPAEGLIYPPKIGQRPHIQSGKRGGYMRRGSTRWDPLRGFRRLSHFSLLPCYWYRRPYLTQARRNVSLLCSNGSVDQSFAYSMIARYNLPLGPDIAQPSVDSIIVPHGK